MEVNGSGRSGGVAGGDGVAWADSVGTPTFAGVVLSCEPSPASKALHHLATASEESRASEPEPPAALQQVDVGAVCRPMSRRDDNLIQ